MTATETLREKHKLINTLVCLVKACEGKETVVELRDNTSILGTILHVDGFSNIMMSSVTYKRPHEKPQMFDEFYIRGSKIRYVHIPNEIDIRKAITKQLKFYTRGRKQNHSGSVALFEKKAAERRRRKSSSDS